MIDYPVDKYADEPQSGGFADDAHRPAPCAALADTHAVFRRWLGESYDLTALDAVLAAAAVDQLDGDPVWLLVVSGSGNAKTETVSALQGAGAHVTSTITSEGALLSATSRKDTTREATGGLLRALGERGVLVIKDVTSILSMNRDVRASVLAALREVYDGRWERNVGTDGGRSLTWTGRLTVIGAVTTAYDTAHAVIASMGDRFALVRVDSNLGRLDAGRQALQNVGHEVAMRAELAQAAGQVLAGVDPAKAVLSEDVMVTLLACADLVTLARTAVERDYRGDVVEAHAPEAPTRFAKMLGQLVRGCLALGASDDQALTGRRAGRWGLGATAAAPAAGGPAGEPVQPHHRGRQAVAAPAHDGGPHPAGAAPAGATQRRRGSGRAGLALPARPDARHRHRAGPRHQICHYTGVWGSRRAASSY